MWVRATFNAYSLVMNSLVAAIFLVLTACSAGERPNPCMQADSDLGLAPASGCSVSETNHYREKIDYTLNKEGLRDRDYELKPAPGILRVLVMGPLLTGSHLTEIELP